MSEMLISQVIHGEVEGSRPLQSFDGEISISGWCLLLDQSLPPPVRISAGNHTLVATGRLQREDVHWLFPSQTAARQSGFLIKGFLPSGIYECRFEAQLPDQSWKLFKALTISVAQPPFTAAIESPIPENNPITGRVYVEGWVMHPREAIRSLVLRYGHQEMPALIGSARSDLTGRIPQNSRAFSASFKTQTILSAARGDLRIKAILSDGSAAIARTTRSVNIFNDENHPIGFPWETPRAGLGPHQARRSSPSTSASQPLNILFVLHGSFSSNSALHVAALANELAAFGHACVVAVPHDATTTLASHVTPQFRGADFNEILHQGLTFPDGRAPDIIHAWTTREHVRQFCETLLERYSTRLLVHLEDNEHEILSLTLKRSSADLAALADSELAELVPSDLSHPRLSLPFLDRAAGVTIITDRLRELVPGKQPTLTLWPAADARFFYPRPFPAEFRGYLTPDKNSTVIFYHGNVHAANATEVRDLYLAVAKLNQMGHAVRLIRCGLDRVDFLGTDRALVTPYVWDLGLITHHHHLPPLMALADIFVQPGAPDAFNDYRFPSKLPEFFSIGRPVVLPRTNLGAVLRHGIDAYILEKTDAEGIASAIVHLREDPALYETLRKGAEACAARLFSWRRSAEELAKFYHTLAG